MRVEFLKLMKVTIKNKNIAPTQLWGFELFKSNHKTTLPIKTY